MVLYMIGMNEKRKYWLEQGILSVLALGVLLVGVEWLLRVSVGLRKIDDIPYTTVDKLRVFTPNVDTIVTGGGFVPIHVKTNAEGYASPEYPVEKSSTTVRVAILGNSFTRGFEVDYDKKFTSVLETNLQNTLGKQGKKYEVMNFGIGGYNYIDQLFVYERYVKKYQPDVVLLVAYLPMDFNTTKVFLPEEKYLKNTPIKNLSGDRLLDLEPTYRINSVKKDWELKMFVRKILAGITEKIYHTTLSKNTVVQKVMSTLYHQWLNLGLVAAPTVQAVTVYTGEEVYFNPQDTERNRLMQFTSEMAMILGAEVERNRTVFGMVVIPSYWEIDHKYQQSFKEKFPPDYDPAWPTKILKNTLKKDFVLLDLAEPLSKAINQDSIQVYIRDTGHFTEAGHQLVGETLVDFLKKEAFSQLSSQR